MQYSRSCALCAEASPGLSQSHPTHVPLDNLTDICVNVTAGGLLILAVLCCAVASGFEVDGAVLKLDDLQLQEQLGADRAKDPK